MSAARLTPTGEEVAAAAAAGDVGVCRWLLARGCPVAWDVLAAAAAANQCSACEWLLDQGGQCWAVSMAMPAAAKGDWLLDSGARGLSVAMFAAAKAGHVELCAWLLRHKLDGLDLSDQKGLLASLAEGCKLNMQQEYWQPLKGDLADPAMQALGLQAAAASPTPDWQAKATWLAGRGVPAISAALPSALLPDGLAWLQWLDDTLCYRPEPDSLGRCVAEAAKAATATAETLQWLLARALANPIGRESCEDLSAEAAGGSVAKLEVTLREGLLEDPLPVRALRDALRRGHRAAAAWLLDVCRASNPLLWSRDCRMGAAAAELSDMRQLEWLREQGLPLGASLWTGTAASGCETALEWLVEGGYEPPADGSPYVTAACSGDLCTLAVLRRLGVPFGDDDGEAFSEVLWASEVSVSPALLWMLEAGMSVCWGLAAWKAARGRGRSWAQEWVREQAARGWAQAEATA
ncbi:hypothetical protein HYH03_010909 [Edaphochlamys debaryana]|uniref:Ankyrin repeat domain-containing protein n=1 Tax=Edaphochlamys debaryana TaxID=47281 RepID=A0A835XVU9_9CHLO|nr:hypothetical protein HYH03_010909 [Edaphochlamys debaryana]|eukprot:KAG2490755.1 hypothetical protein HYH03_010909 [Edaphochlamys debaryana]